MKVEESDGTITVRGGGWFWATFRRTDLALVFYPDGCTRKPSWPAFLKAARKRARDYIEEF